MKVFVSWSGDRSREIAEAIRAWLPKVVQSVKPWMSDQDLSAGSRWLTEISAALNSTGVGLICVTPENQHNPWLLFEAGALSKTLDQTRVCPLVFEMTPGQLTGPLTQFQANSLDRDGIGKILSTINGDLGVGRIEPQQLEEIIDVWWPKLQEKLVAIPAATTTTTSRTTNDQLEELLILAREQLRRENIRLEASRERDEKLDGMIDFMDKAGATLGAFQNQAQRMQSKMAQALEQTLLGQAKSATGDVLDAIQITDIANEMTSIMGPGHMDLSSLQQMAEDMRGIQAHEKERLKQMLSPPIEAEPGK